MVRLLLEDVTLRKEDRLVVEVRYKGGALKSLTMPLPLPFSVLFRTRPEVVEAIDRLLDEHDYQQIVDILNAQGLRSGSGQKFNVHIVSHVCKQFKLKTRRQRLRDKGMLTRKEMARKFGVTQLRVSEWRLNGKLVGYRTNYKKEHLYPAPAPEQITALVGRKKQ